MSTLRTNLQVSMEEALGKCILRLGLHHFVSRDLIYRLHNFKHKNMTVEENIQKMKLLLMRAGIREESRITIARFQSGMRYKIQDRLELLPYNDLNDLVEMCIRVEQQLRRKINSKKEHLNTSSSPKMLQEEMLPLQNEEIT